MYGVSKITSEQNIMLTTFPGAQYSAQSLAEHLDVFAKAGIVVDMICQSAPRGSAVDFSFTTSYDNFAAVMRALPAAAKANPPLVSGGYSKINLFGEEYGWRYYLTPALQNRFGARRGALAVGVLWGLWHLPLNLFFYSPDTSLQSIAAQLVVCVTLGVFFTFAYEKCGKNIWLPVVLHYLNNNMVLVWTGTADISNQIISWTDVAISAIMYGVVFLPFLAAKCYRKNK